MTNPVSSNISAEPPFTAPIANPDSLTCTPQWQRYFNVFLQRTGGTAGVDSADISATAGNALTIANTAQTDASEANAAVALNTVATATAYALALSAETQAQTAYGLASTVKATALAATNNLSDVANLVTARSNLGVSILPVTLTFDTLPAGLSRYVPIVRNLIVPSDFAGTVTWCGGLPTASAVFQVNYLLGSSSTNIGSITIVPGLPYYNLLYTNSDLAYTLLAGGALQIVSPSPADASLQYLSITLALTLD